MTTVTRDSARTRRAVLDAGAELLGTRGGAVTVAEVATAAGVTKGGLLHHFPSRDALLLAVVADTLEQFREIVQRHVDFSENRPGKTLRAYVRALCGPDDSGRNLFENTGVWRAVAPVPGVQELIDDDIQFWKDWFDRDEVDPQRTTIVQHAAEGLAMAGAYDPAVTGERLAELCAVLLGLTEKEGPLI